MKKRFILFACIVISAAFTACRNEQVIGLLRFPSELDFLEVNTFAADLPLGGAVLEPGLRASVFDYTVTVAKDTDRFAINAGFNGKGTVKGLDEGDQKEGLEFSFYTDKKEITLTVQKEWMKVAKYRLTVVRDDPIPVAEDIIVRVEPEIGAFFIESGVIPTLRVTARLPDAGGELSYQWYVGASDDTRGGLPLDGATDDYYTMKEIDTRAVRTIYYYVEVTNTIEGRTGLAVSSARRVSFTNKSGLDIKSREMADIPAGQVTNALASTWLTTYFVTGTPWNTPGFSIGKYPVTWELWKTIFNYADIGGYRFTRSGNQGAALYRDHSGSGYSTNTFPRAIGNRLNPVTLISWREAVIWCNAYSEMDGLDPVYRDSNGIVLRDSRMPIEIIIDESAIANYNGYRLPTAEEWMYAARGANPQNASPWTDDYPGTNDEDEEPLYIWASSPKVLATNGELQTGEVGSMLPNSIGLYDMHGMVYQWVWWPAQGYLDDRSVTLAFGAALQHSIYIFNTAEPKIGAYIDCSFEQPFSNPSETNGFRLVRNKE